MAQRRLRDMLGFAVRIPGLASGYLSPPRLFSPTSTRVAASRLFSSSNMHKDNPFELPLYTFSSIDPSRRSYYVRRGFDDAEEWGKQALQGATVAGFDIEWRPNFVKGRPSNRVATIQVASGADVSVVHIHSLGRVPLHLQNILRDPNVLKVGVGIDADVKKLERDWQVEVVNVLDLSVLARAIDPYWDELDDIRRQIRLEKQREQEQQQSLLKQQQQEQGQEQKQDSNPIMSTPGSSKSTFSLASDVSITTTTKANPDGTTETNNGSNNDRKGSIGLKALATRYLSMHLQKSKKVQTGNWEGTLTDRMLEYAANDAYIAYDVYQKLNRIANEIDSLPTQPVIVV